MVNLIIIIIISIDIVFALYFEAIPRSVLTDTDDFIAINNSNCVCEGYNLVYECSITGHGTIIWRGIAFECPHSSDEIVLFQNSRGIHVCNDGAITGRIIGADNNTYMSQLTVLVSDETIGMNVSCFHDSKGTENLIGSSLLTLTGNVY